MERGEQGFWEYLQGCKKNDGQGIEHGKDENQCVNGTDVMRVPEKVNWKKREL